MSTPPVPPGLSDDRPTAVASRLNSVAIHLLRRIARTDQESGLTAERMSLLSVLVYGGVRTVGELAVAERLSPPAITRTVSLLERGGLVVRRRSRRDQRVVEVSATARGRELMEQARARRVAALARDLARLGGRDLAVVERAVVVLDGLISAPPPGPRDEPGAGSGSDPAAGTDPAGAAMPRGPRRAPS